MYVRGREVKYNLVGGKPLSPPNVYWFAFSALLLAASVAALAVMGLNLGIEFRGGYLVKMDLERPADVGEVRSILGDYAAQGLDKAIVQVSGDGMTLTLRMPYIEETQTRKETIEAVEGRLRDRYGIAEILQEEQVGSEWGREVSSKALIALGVFLVVILIYITLRLEFKMAVTAIAALIHDTIITVGIYALTRRQVTPVTVIAFLTILGYSLYDTIVVFDRVEENTNLMARAGRISFSGIVNESVNQTLMRSIGTTLTTLLPIITILVFGGETLKDFAFALFLGVLLGGYSSIFIASPLLAMWKEREPRYAAVRERVGARGAREAILVSKARAAGAGKAAPEGAEEVVEEAAARGERSGGKTAAAETPGGLEAAAEPPAAKPTPARPRAAGKPSAGRPSAAQQRKKATTKGPGGGRKKKKKKR
ncbi:MAG: protein translocase subunit SecF [Actinobacteria bacterium]|nr:protein translocase subunit SecF [Actinomycetota bacterium]